MKMGKEFIRMLVYVVIVLVFIQLFRMDIIFSTSNIENMLTNEYDTIKTTKLSLTDTSDYNKNRFLIIYNEEEAQLNNIEITLDYLNVEYDVMKSSEKLESYKIYNTIIMLEHNLTNMIDIDNVLNYISEGGQLIYLIDNTVSKNDKLVEYAPVFGIQEIGESKETNNVYFDSEILSGIYGELNLGEPEGMKHKEFKFIQLETTDDSQVHMATDKGQPLIWNKQYNKGNIMVLNLGNYEEKAFRGFLTGAISIMQEVFIYPIINAEVVFLDDFPADYNANPEILRKNYGRNTERFMLDMWWPDMIKLMEKYNLVYTGAYIETYNDIVSGPFENNEAILSVTKHLMSDLLKYNGEIAFHGYNHQSLLFNKLYSDRYGYKAWKNGDEIIKAINTSTSYFNQVYPNYNFYTYVPPSNLLEEEVIPSLLKAIPSIRTISGVYNGEIDENGKESKEVFEQEFGIDDRYGVSLPRITSGAFYTDDTRYNLASAVTIYGIVNHFVHPDDVQDPDRSNGLLWEELYLENDNLFGKINQYYGWLEKTKASSAAEKVKQYVNADVIYSLEEDEKGKSISIVVDNIQDEVSLILATNYDITYSENCEYEKID